jgi:hypothetical protein
VSKARHLTLLPDVAVVASINASGGAMTPPQSQFGPCRRDRGTVCPSGSSELITDWSSRRHTKMLISNEADRLVYEPGLAGHKSESDDEPRFTLSVTGPFLCDYERFLSRFLRRVRVEIRP